MHIQPDSKKYLEIDPRIKEFISEEESANSIIVSERLISPHPLIELTRDILSNKKPIPGSHGTIRVWNEKTLDLRVTPGSLRRALRIIDAVVKSFEERKFKVAVDTDKDNETYALIHDEKLRFSLIEKIRQLDHEQTEEEKKNPRASFWSPRYDYKPTGLLTLRINEWGAQGLQKSWSDGKKRLEDKLNDFVIGAVKVAVIQREEHLESQREWKERQRKQEEERQRRIFIENFINNLEIDSESWAKSKIIRSYIREVEKKVAQRLDRHTFQGKYEEWLSMANQYVDQIDPFQRNLPFEGNNTNSATDTF